MPSIIDHAAIDELSAQHQVEHYRSDRDRTILRVSSIGDCSRRIGYEIQNAQQGQPPLPIWSHGLAIFDVGHAVHLRLQHRLSNAGMGWVDADPIVEDGQFSFDGNFEVPLVDPARRIRGTLDALTRPMVRHRRRIGGKLLELLEPTDEDDPRGRRMILDIKTISGRDKLKEDWKGKPVIRRSSFEWNVNKGPDPKHITQASMYAWMCTQPGFQTSRLTGPLTQIPDVAIIYLAKDLADDYYERHEELYLDPKGLLNSPYMVYLQQVDVQEVEAHLAKAARIWERLDAGALPARDYSYSEKKAFPCGWCPFKATCYVEEGFFTDPEPEIPPRVKYRLGEIGVDPPTTVPLAVPGAGRKPDIGARPFSFHEQPLATFCPVAE